MPALLSVTYNDYGAEASNVKLNMATITAANFDQTLLDAASLYDAIAGVTLGIRVKHTLGNVYQILPTKYPAADDAAQRELKWKVNCLDATAMKPVWFTLPCADTSKLDPNNRGFANIGDAGPVDALVSAIESLVLSADGNSLTVESIELVGRNV